LQGDAAGAIAQKSCRQHRIARRRTGELINRGW
jgi:hypothetical protein